ncbi:hypothetical protein SCHPADRAFT_65784 [Schizopora paradoxa]|uniref:Nephrocystin 3-like N-terminal domain-containing protein n=1 Tax=Schizopora paradoxa TaxID=27342 RepID=A0A0H2SR37_9AGAM|nr:hypothetical protein SCHPADRAFT_65784 [Schizopora paradoxa]
MDLAGDMSDALRFTFTTNTYPEPERDYAEYCALSLLKLTIEASNYVFDVLDGRERIPRTQVTQRQVARFHKDVEEYRSQIQEILLDFRIAVAVQGLCSSGIMRTISNISFFISADQRITIEDQEDDVSLLRRKLGSFETLPINGGCLPGMEKAVLSSVGVWLKSKGMPNVFWVSGTPGSGKVPLAITIITRSFRSTDPRKHFTKKRLPGLNNPRSIWPSISSELAILYRRAEAEILEHMACGAYSDDMDIETQFRFLIFEPLMKQFTPDPTSAWRLLVVIDAIGLSIAENQGEWEMFFDTIVKWCERLPRACKLIVRGFTKSVIEAKLKSTSHPPAFAPDAEEVDSNGSDGDTLNFL